MIDQPEEFIAGRKRTSDWLRDRDSLAIGGNPADWKAAFDTYFVTRLHLRYLNPIKILQDNGTFVGEGFSIAAIQCSLIEFLESTLQGTSYKFVKKGEKLAQHEYLKSSDVFKTFLTTRKPFAAEFDEDLAESFYEGVRCALLHEARTRLGWKIRGVDSSVPTRIVNRVDKILFRDGFQAALLAFINWYAEELAVNRNSQEAFIRKFNSLCA